MRKKGAIKRKNFFPTLIVIIGLWLGIGLLVYFVEPKGTLPIFLFFFLIFLAFIFTFATLLANTRRGLIVAGILTIFLLLRFFGVGHGLNFLLLVGIGIASEVYFQRF